MRGDDNQQGGMFSYISPEKRVPTDHPLRPIGKMVDEVRRWPRSQRSASKARCPFSKNGRCKPPTRTRSTSARGCPKLAKNRPRAAMQTYTRRRLRTGGFMFCWDY
jgi:hypothetical protein